MLPTIVNLQKNEHLSPATWWSPYITKEEVERIENDTNDKHILFHRYRLGFLTVMRYERLDLYLYIYYFYFIWFLKGWFRQQNTETANRWKVSLNKTQRGKGNLNSNAVLLKSDITYAANIVIFLFLHVHQEQLRKEKTKSGHWGTYHEEPLFILICRKGIMFW